MKNYPKLPLLAGMVAIALCFASVPAMFADPFTPIGTSFGPLPGATFGGTGLNGAVETWTNGPLTLGLTATQRFVSGIDLSSNATVTNDGAGTFFAYAGNDGADGSPTYAKWNFGFHVSGLTDGQFVKLFMDKDPSAGNDVTMAGDIISDYQDSWNLGMGFLGGGFDPNVNGEYAFALVAFNAVNHQEMGRSAILVKVTGGSSVPDSGLTLTLLGVAFLGLATMRRRFVR